MRILIIGCGSIGSRHARNLRDLAECAVFDRSSDAVQRVAAESGAVPFDSFEEALAWGADGAIIATPTSSHLETARECVIAGMHVLIEKPISDSPKSVAPFLEFARSREKRVFVACNMRYHPAVRAVRENLARIGEPRFARAHYGNYLPDQRPGADYRESYAAQRDLGGGVILDAGIHELDYLSMMLGPPKNVECVGGRLSDLEIDVEDFATLNVRHSDSCYSVITLDYLRCPKSRGCEIVGTDGTIVWQSSGKKPEVCTVKIFRREEAVWESLLTDQDLNSNLSYIDMLKDYLTAIEGHGDGALCTGEFGDIVLDCCAVSRARIAGHGVMDRLEEE